MPRVLIILVAVVVLLAAGAIGVLAMRGQSPTPPAAPLPAPPVAALPQQDESPAPVAQNRPAPQPAEPTAAAPVEAVAEPALPEDSASPDAKAAALLDSLSEEETQAVMREMGRRQMRKWQEQMKYQLPSDMKLSGLQWHDRGAHKLDEAQRARIKQLNDSFKPRLEGTLEANWDQENALREQITAAQAAGRIDEIRPLMEQMLQVHQQINAVKGDLDKEYRELLRSVLTPEQMGYLESNQGYTVQSWGGPAGGPVNTR